MAHLTNAGEIGEDGAARARSMPSGPKHCQQYLAKPGSRPYCSARPSGVLLDDFPGAAYKLPPAVWSHYDWSIDHCMLRGENSPIQP